MLYDLTNIIFRTKDDKLPGRTRSCPMQLLGSPTIPSSRIGVHSKEMYLLIASLVTRYWSSPETSGIGEPESVSTCRHQKKVYFILVWWYEYKVLTCEKNSMWYKGLSTLNLYKIGSEQKRRGRRSFFLPVNIIVYRDQSWSNIYIKISRNITSLKEAYSL